MAQQALTWQEIRDRFLKVNPTLVAGQINLQESKAQETTAYLRPNPDFTFATDGTQLTPFDGGYRPFAGTQFSTSVSYLHERRHKRELRLESAQKGTAVAESQQTDLERNLIFNLHNAFVQALQAKAVLALAQENLAYYDQLLSVSGDRFKAGDIARVDLDRLQVQRIQYETDVQTGTVSLRTAKIQLLALLNDRTPVEQFDIRGPFENFTEQLPRLEELHATALANRPDLRAAAQGVDKAQTDYRLANANGSTDPTFSTWWTHNPSFNNPFDNNTIGASVSLPLRIFDRNQGEKARTQLDITRNQRLRDANEAQVYNDVDSAYATVSSNLTLLRRYKSTYLVQAGQVRDTIAFSYQRGGASLLDFLNAQSDYRSVRLNYLNLVGSYLTAANQLNLAAGQEVMP
ncbi:MAG TPA: TolC family protein [Bryobacteraceae bacterium]|nr:TolC family protein [Bryobacteraceae bacterium]